MKRFMVVSTLLLAISVAAVPSALAASRFGWGGRPVYPGQAGSRAGVEADQADRSILGEPRAATTDGIVGTWLLNIVEGAGYRFKALVTFGADGTVVGASQGDVCCGLNFTAQHGAWKLNGNKILAVAMFSSTTQIPETWSVVRDYEYPFNLQAQAGVPGIRCRTLIPPDR